MQWTFILAALIVVVVATAAAVGWKLPTSHRATLEAEFRHAPDELWAVLADFPALPAWMPGVRRVQKLDAVDGRERWLYETAEGDMTIEVVTCEPPADLTIRTVNSELGFGGTWTHRISPVAGGSRLSITEHGWIRNPLFRFMFRYVFGDEATLDETVRAIGRRIGERVQPRAPASMG